MFFNLNINKILLGISRAFVVLALGITISAAQGFSFVALGDMPYGKPDQAYPPYRGLIASINQAKPLFSIHVGDFKGGSTECSDQEFSEQRKHFSMFEAGVVYTPGDNDWTDCHRRSNGAYDPLERLAKLRQDFYAPNESLGMKPFALVSQPASDPKHALYVENQRWVVDEVLFVTLHIVGSNNNFETRDTRATSEFFSRDAANIAWVREAFKLAEMNQYRAIVFAFQANVFISRSMWEDFPAWSGFRNSIGQTLLPIAKEWNKPILIIHGDGHQLHFDQPFKIKGQVISNITRLEVPGASDVRAVKVAVDLSKDQKFGIWLISPLDRR
ncbi:MAG: hypothetical protein NWS01_10645 [Burkholderiales bacterium]|jgi:hypothetical protein|nr:hypothetical protein [Burkholderiales bacterium]